MQANKSNRLAEKLDAMDHPEGFDGAKTWAKLEHSLARETRKRRSKLNFATAAVLLALISSLAMRYIFLENLPASSTFNQTPQLPNMERSVATRVPSINARSDTQAAISTPPFKVIVTTATVSPGKLASNPIAHFKKGITSDTIKTFAVIVDTPQSTTITIAPWVVKKPLRVMHINEINYENGQRAREEQLYSNDPFTYSADQLITPPAEQSKTPLKKLIRRLSTPKFYNN